MELKEGMYVRTKHGVIFKIIGGNQDNWEIDIPYWYLELIEEDWLELYRYNDNGCWFTSHEWKSSFNIIDLIEVGDYVNGGRVCYLKGQIDESDVASKEDALYTEYIDEYGEWYGYEADEIKSIVTHEQFDAMKYEVK